MFLSVSFLLIVRGKTLNVEIKVTLLVTAPSYKVGDKLATRQAYGTAVLKLAKNNDRVVALDGDMKNSTFSQEVRKVRALNFDIRTNCLC